MKRAFSAALLVLGTVFLTVLPATAQEKSVNPGINKPFENPDLKDYLGKFEGESREIAAKAKEIVNICKLRPGMVIADVGAGTGLFTRRFAVEVGDKGKIYAVDISPTFLRHIEKTCADSKIKNIETIQCDQFSTKLSKNSVDLVFLCDTYHHFEFPQRTLQSIHDALRPGGQIILIDFHRIKGKSSDFVMGHVRAGQEVFVREITSAGFKVIAEEKKLLKENYFVRLGKKEAKEGKLDLHIVPTPIKSYRLLAMSMDDDDCIWAGAIHKVVHRYDPRTGKVEDVPMPFQATASACICVGKKVYILGQAYPKLIIYDRSAKKFSEVAYPSANPNVWYATEAHDGRHIFLFDRGGVGIIKWDTQSETGKVIAWPYKVTFPSSGSYEPRDKTVWCKVWDFSQGQYQPLGIARLDVSKDEFTGYFPFPKNDDGLKPYTDPATTLFLPYSLKGKIVPFDFKEKRWCQFLNVPQYGKLFGFMGGPIPHKGCYYFSLSTYNGTNTGCDGKPYHFCNAVLEFDPQTRRFEFPTLEVKDAYYQVAYMLSAKGEFFATGSNIREKDGTPNRDRAGEVVFWQTMEPDSKTPTIKRLGTIDLLMVETTPVVFKDRLYRFEYVRDNYPANKTGTSFFRFIDVATGKATPAFAKGQHLGCAFVDGDVVYAFGVDKWGGSKITVLQSKDMEKWDERLALHLPGWVLFNTSVCEADGRYIMAIEVGGPKDVVGVPFTIFFAESKDLLNWRLLPQECVYSKEKYTACPSLRYLDGYFYMIYLETRPGPTYETFIVRSKDLQHWESSRFNPVMAFSDEDKKIANLKLTAEQRKAITQAKDINNSDVDLCEFKGKTIIYYSWGNQQGNEFLAEGVYDGSLASFLRSYFP